VRLRLAAHEITARVYAVILFFPAYLPNIFSINYQFFGQNVIPFQIISYLCSKYLPIVVNDASYGWFSECRVAVRFSRV